MSLRTSIVMVNGCAGGGDHLRLRSWCQTVCLTVGGLLMMNGCGGETRTTEPQDPPVAVTVDVKPDSVTLVPGDSLQMEATPRDDQGGAVAGYEIRWASEDSTVARVDSEGIVAAVATGSTQITATATKNDRTVSGQSRLSVVQDTGEEPGAFDLDFSTLLGAGGFDGQLWETAFDSNENILVVGFGQFRQVQAERLTTIGPLGDVDVYVAKFSRDGSRLLWLTIIGGSGADLGLGLEIGPSGNILIAGRTAVSGADDFPVTSGVWDRTSNGGQDQFVVKLTADGSALIYSTYLGGSGDDSARGGLTVDANGFAYVVGFAGGSDFLMTDGQAPPRRNTYAGGETDGVITKVSPDGSRIEWYRFVGGSDNTVPEPVIGARFDPDGNLWIHARAGSSDATTTTNAFDRTFNGGESDAYFAKISPDGRSLHFATYFGGEDRDVPEHRLAVDSEGFGYFVGATSSDGWPTINAEQSVKHGETDGYLVKVDPQGIPEFSTYFGGSGRDGAFGPAVDSNGRVFVAGDTRSDDLRTTSGALDSTFNGVRDVMVQGYSRVGSLILSTYLGGSDRETTRWITVDPDGRLIVVGATGSSDFPLTKGAFEESLQGSSDGFVTALRERF